MSAGTIELRQSNGSTRVLVMGCVGNIDIFLTIFQFVLCIDIVFSKLKRSNKSGESVGTGELLSVLRIFKYSLLFSFLSNNYLYVGICI